MATLLDARQERLWRQFLDAADRFSFVRLLAVRRLEEPRADRAEERAALGEELRVVLKQDRDCSQVVDTALVSIERKQWQAAVYLVHGEYEGREDLHAQVDAAIREVRRLSDMAASCFGIWDVGFEPGGRWHIPWEWGQAVLRTAFLREEWVMNPNPGFLVREPKEDWFTAGARAVEILAAAVPAPTVAPGGPQVPDDESASKAAAMAAACKAKMSPRELADKYDVGSAALRARLDRWRYGHDAGYVEVSNAKRNEPKYLYDESAVMPVIESLKAKAVDCNRAANVQRNKA